MKLYSKHSTLAQQNGISEELISFISSQVESIKKSDISDRFNLDIGISELLISRKEKSATKAGTEKVCRNVAEEGYDVYNRPKDLGNLFGVSYIYPLFYGFGLIDVPEKVKGKIVYNKKNL